MVSTVFQRVLSNRTENSQRFRTRWLVWKFWDGCDPRGKERPLRSMEVVKCYYEHYFTSVLIGETKQAEVRNQTICPETVGWIWGHALKTASKFRTGSMVI